MAKVDIELGKNVQAYLIKLGLEEETPPKAWGIAHQHMVEGVRGFLSSLHQIPDPSRDDTPHRVADMFVEDLCWGLDYEKFPKATTTPNGTKRDRGELGSATVGMYNQMVLVDNIQTISLCEHHFQTIYGVAHIAYIPHRQVLGLSKFARINEFFARRPQIQERLTEQVYAALSFILETDNIAVVHHCEHFCMKARGAMQHNAKTITQKMGGLFMTQPSLRQEFLNAIR